VREVQVILQARGKAIIAALAAAVVLVAAAAADAFTLPPLPIPQAGTNAPEFIGSPATPNPVPYFVPPRHPFMAPNGRSNIHEDAYQTDTSPHAGPLGNHMRELQNFQLGECGTHTFDSRDRIVTVCVGLEGPRLEMIDPNTLAIIGYFPLPLRDVTAGNPFTGFSGGGYFYLDDQDRAVIPTNLRQIWVIREADNPLGFAFQRAYDVSAQVKFGDQIISALPDWSGRIWFASRKGVVGTVDRASGAVHSAQFEPIGNSFAVDETGGVFIVTDGAMYRFDAGPDGEPEVTWREPYDNIGTIKPGQTQAGSGTTPTLMGHDYVAITDNADPMDVVVYKRAAQVNGDRLVCKQPVFEQGAGSTDNSLITDGNALVVENNFGYRVTATEFGGTTAPGIWRVDLDAEGSGCHVVWRSDERAPSVVPKLSAPNGLVYTYTKDPQPDHSDAWYFTALDFRTGATVYKRLTGEGLGFNNNYAPVTVHPNGTALVGTLGGLIGLRDGG
jgi:hypothetical protein